jgi:hypothetical protein
VVGLVIYYEGTGQKDKLIGFSFRRWDQVIWRFFEKLAKSNPRFNALDPLCFTLHYVKMPLRLRKNALKTKGRPLDEFALTKKIILHVNAKKNCIAHALVIAIAV